jgi:UDP-N-acetylmuramoyl-L-alanyl-D-glutamate--2,6-diaminopimelate ligase
MMLSELLPDVNIPRDISVLGLSDDSRRVRPGYAFIAVQGFDGDGRAYIGDAVQREASVILVEPPYPSVTSDDVIVCAVDSLASRRGEIASRFFGQPSADMLLVAVTGTNGKTSCSHFTAGALNQLGRHCGVIGTLGYGLPGDTTDTGLTTPGAIELQSILAGLKARSCDTVCLEASSHGLAQGRLDGCEIDVAIFMNITRDHLDYHDTFVDYRNAKRRLFHSTGLRSAVINYDDEFGRELLDTLSTDIQMLSFSLRDRLADVYCTSVVTNRNGIHATVVSPWGDGTIDSALLGEFNLENLLATVCVLGLIGYDIDQCCTSVSELPAIDGRMEAMVVEGSAAVVIDYAHTPDALAKALAAIRAHFEGDIWCVFGCGGDRDRGKRAAMGQAAATLADHVILTDDNPRSEDSGAIIDDIASGIGPGVDMRIEPNRSKAIRLALQSAKSDEVVLIAGKGHEAYQLVDGVQRPFSDVDEVNQCLGLQ